MPDPLPSDIVVRLKSDPTAALAAALIVAGSFPDLVSWALTVFSGDSPRSSAALRDVAPAADVKTNGAATALRSRGNGVAKGVAGAKRGRRAKAADTSREAAARHDEALLKLLHDNPRRAHDRDHPAERPSA